MYIDKYKKEDGYYDENDCFWEDAESFLQGKIFGFCCCGNPLYSLKHIHAGLNQVARIRSLLWEGKITHKEWVEENKKALGSENATYFMWYFLYKEGLTEHGGSVPG